MEILGECEPGTYLVQPDPAAGTARPRAHRTRAQFAIAAFHRANKPRKLVLW
jgi:hypothetical protein